MFERINMPGDSDGTFPQAHAGVCRLKVLLSLRSLDISRNDQFRSSILSVPSRLHCRIKNSHFANEDQKRAIARVAMGSRI